MEPRSRERRIPERLSYYHPGHVSALSPVAPRPASKIPQIQKPSPSTTSHPSKNSSLPTRPATQQQDTTGGSVVNIPVPAHDPFNKMSRIMRQLQHGRYDMLIEEEKRRAFDDEVDLNVQPGQTLQLVSWIRFHRIYQSGRMRVRYLSSRAGSVILVMRPGEIVAVGNSRDIQTMQGEQNAPEIVKQLLEPSFISPENTSTYAVLICDGVKWELVGNIFLKASETSTPPPSSVVEAKPQQVAEQPVKPPEFCIEGQYEEEESAERFLAESGLEFFSNFGDSSTLGNSIRSGKTPPAKSVENCSQSNRSIDIDNQADGRFSEDKELEKRDLSELFQN